MTRAESNDLAHACFMACLGQPAALDAIFEQPTPREIRKDDDAGEGESGDE